MGPRHKGGVKVGPSQEGGVKVGRDMREVLKWDET